MRLLSKDKLPTAIFASNDDMAAGVELRRCQIEGRRGGHKASHFS